MLKFPIDLDTTKRLATFVARRTGEDRVPQVAGSLTFTTVLSLVPLATVAFALFTAFPIFRGEPWEPRLHAVEGQALGKAFPGLTAPFLCADKRCRSLAHLWRRQQFPARENYGFLKVRNRTLVRHGELREPVDLVLPVRSVHCICRLT